MQSKKIFQAIVQYHYASLPPQIAKKVMAIYKTEYKTLFLIIKPIIIYKLHQFGL